MKRYVWLLVVMLVLTACSGEVQPAEPTAAATEEPPAASTVDFSTREPLPPTWTPFVRATVTPFPSATRPPYTPPPTPTTPSQCFGFAADYDRIGDTFVLGTSPTLYWTPISGAPEYLVEILAPDGAAVMERWVSGDTASFTIPAEMFEWDEESLQLGEVAVFGWEVTPVDENRAFLCDPIGGELIPLVSEE